MGNEPERYTKSGQPVYKYDTTPEYQKPNSCNSAMEEIVKHFEKHIGTAKNTYHEIVSNFVHIDIHIIPPDGTRDYYTLFTTGMSDLRMSVPDGAEDFKNAELMICLPKSWPVSEKDLKDERNYWPIRWLKMLARFPHEYNTWLGFGHTMPNGDPAKPFNSNTRLCCMMLSTPTIAENIDEFKRLDVNYYKQINFYSVLPVYKEEMNFKLDNSAEDLIVKFKENNINEILNLDRINVCERRKRFLFF